IKSQGSSAGLSVSCESVKPGNPRPMQFSCSWWYHTYKGILTDITSVTIRISETRIKAATSVSTVSTNGYTTIGRHKDMNEHKRTQFCMDENRFSFKNLLQHLLSFMKLKRNPRKDKEQGWKESHVLGNVCAGRKESAGSATSKRTRRVHCSNTTLRNHIIHPHCEVLKAQKNQNSEAGQTSMARDGSVFRYDPDYLREQFAGLGRMCGSDFNIMDFKGYSSSGT
nr:hypothetical protein [Tanacetum cinerariifolium]